MTLHQHWFHIVSMFCVPAGLHFLLISDRIVSMICCGAKLTKKLSFRKDAFFQSISMKTLLMSTHNMLWVLIRSVSILLKQKKTDSGFFSYLELWKLDGVIDGTPSQIPAFSCWNMVNIKWEPVQICIPFDCCFTWLFFFFFLLKKYNVNPHLIGVYTVYHSSSQL